MVGVRKNCDAGCLGAGCILVTHVFASFILFCNVYEIRVWYGNVCASRGVVDALLFWACASACICHYHDLARFGRKACSSASEDGLSLCFIPLVAPNFIVQSALSRLSVVEEGFHSILSKLFSILVAVFVSFKILWLILLWCQNCLWSLAVVTKRRYLCCFWFLVLFLFKCHRCFYNQLFFWMWRCYHLPFVCQDFFQL